MAKDNETDRATHYHNEGQEDAAKGYGNYNPPESFFRSIVNEAADEANRSYTDGYRHGVKQRSKK